MMSTYSRKELRVTATSEARTLTMQSFWLYTICEIMSSKDDYIVKLKVLWAPARDTAITAVVWLESPPYSSVMILVVFLQCYT